MNVFEKDVTVLNRAGLHTRPAAGFVKLAARFKSEIYITRDGFMINGKSIIGVMTLAAEQGCSLTLKTEGIDAETAMRELVAYFESGFGEI